FILLWTIWDDEIEECNDISEEKFSKIFTLRGRYDEKLLEEYDGAFNDPIVLKDDIRDLKDPICISLMKLCYELEDNRSEKFIKKIMNEMKFWIFASIKENNNVVEYRNLGKYQSFKNYLMIRKYTIGIIPCLSLMENVIGYEIDSDIFNYPSLKRIRYIACVLFSLTNDAFGFWKDIKNNWVNSIIAISQENSISFEEAGKKTVRYHNELVKEFDILVDSLSQYYDFKVKKWIQSVRELIRGLAESGLRNKRYFQDRNNNDKKFNMEFSIRYY
ncbi:3312_t:CDS:1, partial [Scutellospora calospora]